MTRRGEDKRRSDLRRKREAVGSRAACRSTATAGSNSNSYGGIQDSSSRGSSARHRRLGISGRSGPIAETDIFRPSRIGCQVFLRFVVLRLSYGCAPTPVPFCPLSSIASSFDFLSCSPSTSLSFYFLSLFFPKFQCHTVAVLVLFPRGSWVRTYAQKVGGSKWL